VASGGQNGDCCKQLDSGNTFLKRVELGKLGGARFLKRELTGERKRVIRYRKGASYILGAKSREKPGEKIYLHTKVISWSNTR